VRRCVRCVLTALSARGGPCLALFPFVRGAMTLLVCVQRQQLGSSYIACRPCMAAMTFRDEGSAMCEHEQREKGNSSLKSGKQAQCVYL
jgi:hypothetical protein